MRGAGWGRGRAKKGGGDKQGWLAQRCMQRGCEGSGVRLVPWVHAPALSSRACVCLHNPVATREKQNSVNDMSAIEHGIMGVPA